MSWAVQPREMRGVCSPSPPAPDPGLSQQGLLPHSWEQESRTTEGAGAGVRTRSRACVRRAAAQPQRESAAVRSPMSGAVSMAHLSA